MLVEWFYRLSRLIFSNSERLNFLTDVIILLEFLNKGLLLFGLGSVISHIYFVPSGLS